MSKRFVNRLILPIRTVALIPGKVNFTRLSRYGRHIAKTFFTELLTRKIKKSHLKGHRTFIAKKEGKMKSLRIWLKKGKKMGKIMGVDL